MTKRYNPRIADYFGMNIRNKGQGVGIEIEVEGSNLVGEDFRSTEWTVTRDGSLRGEAFEYVLKGPMDVDKAKTALATLEKAFEDRGSQIKAAHRGSVHIHVNMQTKTMEEVLSTIYMWMLVEPLWMTMCGPQRDGNLFCLPSYLSGDLVFYVEGLIRSLKTQGMNGLPERGKYAALNTDSLTSFGSLEFRTFSSTTSAKTISRWVTWCDNLSCVAAKYPLEAMGTVWKDALNNPRAFYESIFGEKLPFSNHELEQMLLVGIDTSSGVTLLVKQYLKELTKELPVT